MSSRWWLYGMLLAGSALLAGTLLLAFAVMVAYPGLPSLEALTDYRPKIPLRIYSADGDLIGEFGEERRSVVKIGEVPEVMIQAVLAAEDDRFYRHGGVDYLGVLRAAGANFFSGGAKQGASTITMQVARNFFLSREKTFSRKFREALLAFKIEHSLAKNEILELYLNQIFLGQRAYGFAAAARIYFGKDLKQLGVAEVALLAGLPKAPSRYNPLYNFKGAKRRQEYVLGRMAELGYITSAQLEQARKQALTIKREQQEFGVRADYLTEMVRRVVYDAYREEAYTKGIRVRTTILKVHQEAAYEAVRKGLLEYDRRHGYRGPESHLDLSAGTSDDALDDLLQDVAESDDLIPAVVLEADAKSVRAYRKGGETVVLEGEGLKFAQRALAPGAAASQRIRRGSLIRVQRGEKGRWQIAQIPAAEAAFVALSPKDGAIRALVGGFDFGRNQYNHATQAFRQPGSSFKPFIYSAALEKGFTPSTIVDDAPVTFSAAETGSLPWEPKNYDDKYEGPMRLRTALAKSKNMVSIRILQAIGPEYAQQYIARFGFDPARHPPYMTLALGAGEVTPLQMAVAYGVFANGGYRISPYFIERIEDESGKVLAETKPAGVEEGAERVIDPRNAFLMHSMMQDVIRYGTGARAMQLGRADLAGKTGTTNDNVDAWFAGYQPSLVGIAWMGFDTPRSLGGHETGAVAALPIWMGYMGKALKGVSEESVPAPEGVVSVRIDPVTGRRQQDEKGGMPEYFLHENPPSEGAQPRAPDEAP